MADRPRKKEAQQVLLSSQNLSRSLAWMMKAIWVEHLSSLRQGSEENGQPETTKLAGGLPELSEDPKSASTGTARLKKDRQVNTSHLNMGRRRAKIGGLLTEILLGQRGAGCGR